MADTTDRRGQEVARTDVSPEQDFELIEEAVMETERGRRFLKEFARRVRAHETSVLLTALERIERMVVQSQSQLPPGGEGDYAQAERVRAADHAVDRLQPVQEKLLDIVWYMRERGFDGSLCTAIQGEANTLREIIGELVPEPEEDSLYDPDAGRRDVLEHEAAMVGEETSPQPAHQGVEVAAPQTGHTPARASAPEVAPEASPDVERPVHVAQAVPAPAMQERKTYAAAPQDDQSSRIATAFAAIDALSEREKFALFS